MKRSSVSRVGVSLFLAVAIIVLAGSWVAPASAAPAPDQPFNYTITARGTAMQVYYPTQSFNWTVATAGTETWCEYGVLLGEWTIEQWAFAETVTKPWPAPANTVIKNWSYTQSDLGWQIAQGWDTGTHIEGSGLNNRLDITYFTGGTILWKGGYKATYRIYGDRYHYDPVSRTQSGYGAVNASQGERAVALFSLAAPPALHGGTVAVNGRTVTDTNARVTTRLDETTGTVYASTSYSETYSGPWANSRMASGTVNISDGDKYIATSTLVAPNGDTTWSVSDSNPNVDTWMEGNRLYARVLSISDKPFNYTIAASGTRTTTTYPDQSFNWTATTEGTETWVESDILLGEMTVLEWGYAQLFNFSLYAPPNSQITRWSHEQHDLGWQYAQGWDGGSYIDGNRLAIKAYTGGTWIWTGGYWATYRIYGNQYHYDPVSMTQSGSGVVNGSEGDKFIANFSLAAPPALHGGTVAINSRSVTDNNARVTTRLDQAAGKVYATTSYSVTTTYPWSSVETGASAINCAEGDKYIATSTLSAPDGNTSWSVSDNNANVDTWMEGNRLYARALNLAPTARDDSGLSVVEDTSLVLAVPGVLGNDFDPEGDIIGAILVTGPSHGGLTLNLDGSFTYIPDPNYTGADSFTYVARDFSRQSAPATVSIGVSPVNDLPTISNIANRTIGEDGTTGPLPFNIGDIETAPGGLTLSAFSSNPALVPGESVVFGGSGASRTLTVTPAPNGNGTATITVSVTDADGGKTEDSFVLTVTAVNDAPTITNIADQTTDEDTPSAAINFVIGDVETPARDLTLAVASSNPALVPNGNIVFGGSEGNRNVTVTPALNRSGTTNITLTVSDGTTTASDSFLLTVNAVNDLPTISAITAQVVNEDESTATISFSVSDEETPAGSLIVSGKSSDPALAPDGNIVLGGSGSSRTVKVNPLSDQNGTCVIAVWVEDSNGGKVYSNFVLTVNPVNDVPRFTRGADQTVLEDAGLRTVAAWATNISSGSTNESSQTLTFIVSSDNSALFAEQPAISPAGTLTYRSAPQANGSAVVSVRLKDNGGTDSGGADTSSTQSFTILVTPVNDAPMVASPVVDMTADEDSSDRVNNLATVFTDADIATNGDVLVLTPVANSNPSLLGASISGSNLTLHFNADQNGSATLTIRATDKEGLWVEDSFTVTVNPVNDLPLASNDTRTTAEDTLLSFTAGSLTTNDSPGPGNESSQTLTVTAVSAASARGGMVSLAGGNLTYVPAANFNGTDTFTYTISDDGTTRGAPDHRSATGTVTVTVNPVNDPPVVGTVSPVTVNEASSLTVDFNSIVSDVETPIGEITLTATSSNPEIATVSMDSATRVATVTGVDNGTAIITLTATDRGDPNGASGGAPAFSALSTSSTSITVRVNNVAPTISSVVNSGPVDEGSSASIIVAAADPSGANDPLSFEFDFNNDGIYEDGPQAGNLASHVFGDNGNFRVNVRVSDGDGGLATGYTTVLVNNVAPTITVSGGSSVNEGSPYALTLGNVIDPGQDTVAGYVINWGDGVSDTFAGSPNSVSKTHTYSDGPGNFVVNLSLIDDDGTFAGGAKSIMVDNIAPSGLTLDALAINENQSATLSGSFIDPGALDTHIVVIAWGDGSPDTTLDLAANVLTFSTGHQYLDNKPADAAYTISVSVTDKDGASTSASKTVVVKNVAPSGLTLDAVAIDENQSTTLSGSFIDPGTLDTHVVVVTWGDGSPNTTLNLAANVLTFSASHQYLDNRPADAAYAINVSVTDKDAASTSASTTVVVKNVAPSGLTLETVAIDENQSTTLGGSFIDPGTLDTHVVVITWGDGTPNTTLNLSSGTLIFSTGHQYLDNKAADAAYAISVSVTDKDGAGASASTTVAVKNVAPSALTLNALAINENQAATLSGSFIDPGTQDTHIVVITWGDGSPDTTLDLPANKLNFSTGHQYLDNKPGDAAYTISVSVTDKDSANTSASTTVVVKNVAPSGLTLNTVAIDENQSTTLGGSFIDPGTLDTHVVVITWGDGTPNTTLNLAAGILSFSSTHQYLDNRPADAAHTIGVSVTDKDSANTSASTTVMVKNVAPSALTLNASPATLNENGNTTVSGTFTDPGTQDTHVVVINWGDGSPDTTLDFSANVLSFSTGHQYLDNKAADASYAISVSVTDKDGANTSASTSVVVKNVAPSGLTLNALAINENQSATLSGSFIDPGALDTHIVVIAWGDGSPDTTLDLAANVLTFSAGHQYLDNKPADAAYTISVSVTDKDGASTSASKTVVVKNVAPSGLTLETVAIDENQSTTLGGSFIDPGTLDTHVVVITWGDGTPNTTLNLAAGILSFSSTHQYLDNRPADAAYAISVSVTDKDGAADTGSTGMAVRNVAPAVEAGTNIEEIALHSVAITASFTDPGTKDTHTAVITWGDGKEQAGIVSETAGSGNVTGSHAYSLPGTYLVTVTVKDKDLGVGSDTLTVTVLGPADLKGRALSSLTPYKNESKLIADAIEDIQESLETTLWLDSIHVEPQHGQKVFDNERQAIGKLTNLLNHEKDGEHHADVALMSSDKGNNREEEGHVSAGALAAARQAIDSLVEADRLLAATLINDAASMTMVDSKRKAQVAKELASAREDLLKGNAERDDGEFDNAIDRYLQAWGHAGQAMEQSVTGIRFLAQLAIAKALAISPAASSSDKHKEADGIDQARSEIIAGDADMAAKSWDKASSHYKNALETALKAIEDAVDHHD